MPKPSTVCVREKNKRKLGTEATTTCVRILLHSFRPHTLVASGISCIFFFFHLHQRCKSFCLRVCLFQVHCPGAQLYIHSRCIYVYLIYLLSIYLISCLHQRCKSCFLRISIYSRCISIHILFILFFVLSCLHQRCQSCFLRISVYSRCTAGPRSLLCKLLYEEIMQIKDKVLYVHEQVDASLKKYL
jgi:hypothetical protein